MQNQSSASEWAMEDCFPGVKKKPTKSSIKPGMYLCLFLKKRVATH